MQYFSTYTVIAPKVMPGPAQIKTKVRNKELSFMPTAV